MLPPVPPERYPAVASCPYAGGGGRHFRHRQGAPKPRRDTQLTGVVAQRLRGVRCGRTFRTDPHGVSHDQTRARLKGAAVMSSVLGMSYGAVAAALAALGWPLSNVAVSYAGPDAGAAVAGRRGEALRHGGGRGAALGVDLTGVRCRGAWLTVGVSVDAVRGTALRIDLLPNGEASTPAAWVAGLAAVLGAEILVRDDADSVKHAAAAAGVDHQVRKAQVQRNTEAWMATITPAPSVEADGSLAAIGVAPWQALADGHEPLRPMTERQPSPAASAALEASHRR